MSKALGETKTGPFSYYKGHRKAVLWDGAGIPILEILDIDFPPYHLGDRQVRGRAFYNIKNRLLSYGEHRWFQDAVKE